MSSVTPTTAAASSTDLQRQADELLRQATEIRTEASQRAELLEKQAQILLNTIRELAQITTPVRRRGRPPKNPPATPESGQSVKRGRGRPLGRKNKTPAERAAEERARQQKAKNRNSRTLDDYVLEVLQDNKKDMRLKDVVVAVRKKGYKSKAQKFENMVYQRLLKLSSDPAVAVKGKDAHTNKVVFRAAA
jgi:hypothetical protein